jgi:hypothetical protein
MKRALVAGILGIAVATNALAQGHVNISNYLVPPYNQVYYVGGALDGQAANAPTITLTVWYALGAGVAENLLVNQGISFPLDATLQGAGTRGNGGWYGAQTQAGLTPGQDYTFQVRATGTAQGGTIDPLASRSATWTEPGVNIVSTANPANTASFSPGVPIIIPEPSSLALGGLASLALLAFRRRD